MKVVLLFLLLILCYFIAMGQEIKFDNNTIGPSIQPPPRKMYLKENQDKSRGIDLDEKGGRDSLAIDCGPNCPKKKTHVASTLKSKFQSSRLSSESTTSKRKKNMRAVLDPKKFPFLMDIFAAD